MTTSRLRQTGVIVLLLTFSAATLAAQTPRSGSSAAQRGQTRGGGSARAVLPDPELLDGSKQKPDKRSEYGMIGDFELPGDENARTAKVGGPQNPSQGQSGQQQGGGAGGAPQPGGQGQESGAQGGQAQAGQQPGGQQGTENAVSSPDANGQPEGRQVAELTGDAQGQAGGEAKPQQVSIGDAAMKIETQNVAGVVGTQQAGQTQQHEKGTGTGGKGPTGNNSNKGAERGRTMPSGL